MTWRRVTAALSAMLAALAVMPVDAADPAWTCAGPRPNLPATTPTPRVEAAARERFETTRTALARATPRIIMFGDSLTQRWDQEVWDKTLAPRGAFNLGVNGDRTEHLLWRLRNGHMPSRAPERHVVMIGTNNIGRGHPLVDVAEGVRAIIETLRAAHPATPVLVITPPPRADRPDLTRRVAELAAMLPACDDGDLVRVRDLGAALLDHGRLTRESAPDGLHFSASGYRRLSAALLPALDGHRPAPRQ